MPKKSVKQKKNKAWIVTVDMGYGHQRAAYPLKRIAEGDIITANTYAGIPDRDKKLWQGSKRFYEFISRFKKFPFIGEKAFELFDKLQSIPQFYPRRDLSESNIQVRQMYSLFKRYRWGEHLIAKLARNPLPIVTTFFATAFMADYYEYPGEIYCLATDTDISRAWVPIDPQRSKINYFAPNLRVQERLKLYGVREEQIFLTGFPLPDENVGNELSTIKCDFGQRIPQLDPNNVFRNQYQSTVIHHIGKSNYRTESERPMTITFAVGGAGAQRELGVEILKSLRKLITADKVAINLVAGTHHVVNVFFKQAVKSLGLSSKLGTGVNVIFNPTKDGYFAEFDEALRTTDILWTKPSELSFYCALGIPIIMAQPIGSQELFNQKWLQSIGAGIDQEDPRYTNEWLMDWLNSGWLAEAALHGFLEAPQNGTYNIEKVVFHEMSKTKKVESVLQY